MKDFFGSFDIFQVISAFIFLIAIIDPVGNIPVTINMEERGIKINAFKVSLASFIIFIVFLLLGETLLQLFGIPIEFFGIAGGFIIFLMSLEMVFDMEFFKPTDLGGSGDLVPLAFPMYAGPGAFTALLSMTGIYSTTNLLFAIVLSMIVLYLILVGTHWLSKRMGEAALYIVRKFFGILVMAIAVKLVFGNLAAILTQTLNGVFK